MKCEITVEMQLLKQNRAKFLSCKIKLRKSEEPENKNRNKRPTPRNHTENSFLTLNCL